MSSRLFFDQPTPETGNPDYDALPEPLCIHARRRATWVRPPQLKLKYALRARLTALRARQPGLRVPGDVWRGLDSYSADSVPPYDFAALAPVQAFLSEHGYSPRSAPEAA